MSQILKTKIPFIQRFWLSCFVFALLVIAAIFIVGKIWIDCLDKKRDNQIQQTITTVLKEEAKVHSLLPDILILNVSGQAIPKLKDTIKNQLANYLANRYLSRSDEKNEIRIQPYLTFLDNGQISDTIFLTKAQLNEIKKHIEFLVSTVDKAVETSKANIDTEISKINTWVTIWIGVFGFLGIFLPIVINIKSFDSLQKLEKDASDAQANANAVKDVLDTHEDDIKAIPNIRNHAESARKEIDKLLPKLVTAEGLAKDAIAESRRAIKISELNNKLIIALNALGKLKEVENIYSVYGSHAIDAVKDNFTSVYNELMQCKEHCAHNYVLNVVRELGVRLRLLSTNKFVNRAQTEKFNAFALFINKLLKAEMTISVFEQFLEFFKTFLDQLSPQKD